MSRCEKELGKEKERVTKDGPRWHSASSRSDILYLAVDNQSAGFYLDPAIPFLLAFPRTTMLIVADAHNLVLRRLTISPPPCYAAPTTEYQNLEPRVLCQSAIYRTNVAVNHFELTVGSMLWDLVFQTLPNQKPRIIFRGNTDIRLNMDDN